MSTSSKYPLKDLVIKTAVVRRPDIGFIFAYDPKTIEDNSHTIAFRWKSGILYKGDRNYNAHSACIITTPEPALLDISEIGYYAITTSQGINVGDIIKDSFPPSQLKRYVGFRLVAEIDGKAYAAGLNGMVYRLDAIKSWTRIDSGLPASFEIESIDGFNSSDIYAVGFNGEMWHFNGETWLQSDLPTNENLNIVRCAKDGSVYIAGHNGILICGRNDVWTVIQQEETQDHIWDLEWFNGYLYVATMKVVYRLKNSVLEKIDFGADSPKTCYQLSAAEGVMWSNGAYDIMSFDGKVWTRIV